MMGIIMIKRPNLTMPSKRERERERERPYSESTILRLSDLTDDENFPPEYRMLGRR